MHNERLQKFIEEEVLGDGTTLESLLQVEADVQSGSTTAAHEKQKLLLKTKNFLANKIADHLLNEHRLAKFSHRCSCQSSMEDWMRAAYLKEPADNISIGFLSYIFIVLNKTVFMSKFKS